MTKGDRETEQIQKLFNLDEEQNFIENISHRHI